jgi:hypothetical protein
VIRHHHHHVVPIYRHHVRPVYPRTQVYYGIPTYQVYHPPVYGGFFYGGPGISISVGF